ncbi:MAG TPA: ROK family protein [Acidimicrobiales bacterium]|nr:ROK family protein [Acidimicrobiales bacterium]
MPTPPARPGRASAKATKKAAALTSARAKPSSRAGARQSAAAGAVRESTRGSAANQGADAGTVKQSTRAKAAKQSAAAGTVRKSTRASAASQSAASAEAGAAVGAQAATGPAARQGSGLPRTLSFDIGGTGLKASVLSKHGELLHEPVRILTPYPLRPEQLVATLGQMATGLPSYQRVSAGFPGMVRDGRVLSAPHFVCPAGEGGKPSVELEKAWSGFELQQALAAALGRPCRVANDADVQGAAIVKGEGLELVVTLGTGVGTALFWQGKLAPHIELAHHPLSKRGKTYNDVLGEAARKKDGSSKWNQRVLSTLEVLKALVFYDHCYIGGGNSTRVKVSLPPDVTLADNSAGIIGGIKLWERT